MTTTLYLFFGIYFVSMSITTLIQPNAIKSLYNAINSDDGLKKLSGLFTIILGAALVSIHNKWELDKSLIITLLAWLTLIKGMLLLSFDRFSKFFGFIYNMQDKGYQIIGIVIGLLGILFIILGAN